MVLAQMAPARVRPDRTNAAVVFDEVPESDPEAQRGNVYWPPYIGSRVQNVVEAMSNSASVHVVVRPEIAVWGNWTTEIEFEASSPLCDWLPRLEPSLVRISYRNSPMVQAYLACHPEIWGFLEEARPVLAEIFGGLVDIVLEVITYPEEGAEDELVAWIQSTNTVDEGLEKLDRFEDEWAIDHLTSVATRFNFNIETR
jgi:hypothetical protein